MMPAAGADAPAAGIFVFGQLLAGETVGVTVTVGLTVGVTVTVTVGVGVVVVVGVVVLQPASVPVSAAARQSAAMIFFMDTPSFPGIGGRFGSIKRRCSAP